MNQFTYSIQMAFLLFPFVALIFTMPYMVYQYHRYGSVNSYRSIIIYSFLLYLMAAYFLVILPLPSIESVSQMKTPAYNLVPFQFVSEIFSKTGFQFSDFATYFPSLKNPVVYEAFFNILLTFPLGVYLHYYFQFDFKKTAFYSFCCSLFFELTQLTGLYFIYPRGYRVFDIDDLILNTLGGILGYFLATFLLKFLPSRDSIDAKSIKKGIEVSFIKRLFCFVLDAFIVSLFLFCSLILMKNFKFYSFSLFLIYSVIMLLFYFVILVLMLNNRTLGMRFFHLRFKSSKKIRWYHVFDYYFFFFFEYILVPLIFIIIGIVLYSSKIILKDFFEYYLIIVMAFTFMMYIITFLKRIFKMKTFPELLSGISLESTIKI